MLPLLILVIQVEHHLAGLSTLIQNIRLSMDSLLVFVGVLNIILSFFLFKKNENKVANWVLSVWLLSVAFSLMVRGFGVSSYNKERTILLHIIGGVSFLYSPFLWLYVRLLTKQLRKVSMYSLIHFLPFFLYLGLVVWQYHDLYIKEEVITKHSVFLSDIWTNLATLQGGGYTLWTLIILREYRYRIITNFSNIDSISLFWVKVLTVGLLLNYFIGFFSSVSDMLGYVTSNDFLEIVTILLLLVIAFGSLKQSEVPFIELQESMLPKSIEDKYYYSRLDKEEMDNLGKKIINYLETEKPYLNAEFRIKDLADALETNPNDASRVINEGFQQNFFGLINHYRVEEVKRQMKNKQNEHLTLLAIGLQAGFNSKTTFNTVFKKITGKTPSQYKKEINS